MALCEAVSHYDGVFYATHARVGNGKHISAIQEAIEIGNRSGIPVQFSHLAITDWRVYGDGPKMVEMFVEARQGGLDITYDMYPYTAAGAGFNQLIPLWVQAGTVKDFIARLKDPAIRPRVRDEVAAGLGGLVPKWETWYVAYIHSEGNRHLVGMNIAEIAEERGIEPAEAVLQVMVEENGSVPTRVHNRIESDVRYFMGHELAMIGSDGRAVSPNGPYKNALPSSQVLRHLPAHPGPLRPRAARRPHPGERHPQDGRLPGSAHGHEGPRPPEGGPDGRPGRLRP